MSVQSQIALDHLEHLARLPATPFLEQGPMGYILETLEKMGIPSKLDQFGNIIARYSSGGASNPPIALVAHMDHPGYELIEKTDCQLIGRGMGGLPASALVEPTRVLLVKPDGTRLPGTATPHQKPIHSGKKDREHLFELVFEGEADIHLPAPVILDLPDFQIDGDVIKARALDDLAGCAAILTALEQTLSISVQTELYGIFTRAEEEGLYGARLMAENETLPLNTIIVSVESSALIPGVFQGAGPVIRTGDAASTFNGDAESILIVAAKSLSERQGQFKSQRHLMKGGICEATAFANFGYRVTGVAFPLANYHNGVPSLGDQNGGIDTEAIYLSDFFSGVALLTEAVQSVDRVGQTPIRQRMKTVPNVVRERLENLHDLAI